MLLLEVLSECKIIFKTNRICDDVIIVNLSGRGDKDIFTIADALADTAWKEFITTKAEEYSA